MMNSGGGRLTNPPNRGYGSGCGLLIMPFPIWKKFQPILNLANQRVIQTRDITLNPSLTAISYFFHLVATVIWLGGMALLVLVIWPAQRRSPDELLDTIEKRFRPMANFSLLVLLMTGVVQTSSDDNYGGMLDFSNDWSKAILAKHLAFIGMVGIVAFLQFGLEPALERAKLLASRGQAADDLNRLRQRQRFLTQVNFGLSLVVLLFTAIATAL